MSQDVKDPMEYIWDKIPKNKQGLVHYLAGDLPYLYRNGFVDTNRFSFEDWMDAFEDCLQDDGSYLVSREKFFSLRKFRYEGPVFKPFDPNKIKEGLWSDQNLQKLFERSILPSSGVTQDIFWNSVKALKKQGLEKDGQLLVNETVKKQLAYLIDRFPSPRRRLEKEVDRIRTQREEDFKNATASRDQSGFSVGKMAVEAKSEKFKNLESSSSTFGSPDESNDKDSVDLKSLKKPPRKIQG